MSIDFKKKTKELVSARLKWDKILSEGNWVLAMDLINGLTIDECRIIIKKFYKESEGD